MVYPRTADDSIYCDSEFQQKLEVPSFDAFYAPFPDGVVVPSPDGRMVSLPDEIPEHSDLNGKLIRYQRIPQDVVQGNTHYQVYRVLYVSSMKQVKNDRSSYKPFATSAYVSFPTEYGRIKTGLQTLLYTHPTVGVNSTCGPSRWDANSWNKVIKNWMFDSNLKSVAPDYPGLGFDSGLRSSDYDLKLRWEEGLPQSCVGVQPFENSGHPYVSIQAEGRSAIDGVRAAQWIERVLRNPCTNDSIAKNTDFAVVGASQGGHAALAVGELMSEWDKYAPVLELLSIVAGAPASKLLITAENRNLPMVLVAFSLEFLNFKPSEFMDAVGMCSYSRGIDTKCVQQKDIFNNLLFGTYQPLLYGVNPFVDINPFIEEDDAELEKKLRDNEYFMEAFEANTPGNKPIKFPIMIGQVEGDPVVTTGMTDELVDNIRNNTRYSKVMYCKYSGNGNLEDPDKAKENHTKVMDKMFSNILPIGDNSCIDPDTYEYINATDFLRNHLLDIRDND